MPELLLRIRAFLIKAFGGLLLVTLLIAAMVIWYTPPSVNPDAKKKTGKDSQAGSRDSSAEWLERTRYRGESIDELIAKEGQGSIYEILFKIEQAIEHKGKSGPNTKEEKYVPAVLSMEREVNNGGYHQYFINSSVLTAPVIVEALNAIGCPKTAAITTRAISVLAITGELTPENIENTARDRYDEIKADLGKCDSEFYDSDEPLAERLFDWIKQNRDKIMLGGK